MIYNLCLGPSSYGYICKYFSYVTTTSTNKLINAIAKDMPKRNVSKQCF